MVRKGPGSRFMNAWESVKRSFVPQDDDRTYEIGPLKMDGVGDSAWYDEEEAMVKLTWFVDMQSGENVADCHSRTDIYGLFEPVVHEIIRLVSEQKDQAMHSGHSIDVSLPMIARHLLSS